MQYDSSNEPASPRQEDNDDVHVTGFLPVGLGYPLAVFHARTVGFWNMDGTPLTWRHAACKLQLVGR